MKNITLAIDDDLLIRGRDYAFKHNTSLNQLVRDLIEKTVDPPSTDWWEEIKILIEQLPEPSEEGAATESSGGKRSLTSTAGSIERGWTREDAYDREICRGSKIIH
jgi:hypothetical protein